MVLSTQAYHDSEFLKEVWGLFGVGCGIIMIRTFVRLRTVGIRNFQGDDWLTFLVLLCYTADAITVDLTYRYGSNVDYTPEKLATFSAQEIWQVTFGGRMQLFAWYTYTALVWGLKGCMLFFFNRLTFGLDYHVWVKRLAIVCVLTYIAVFLTITFGCRPYHLNWQALPYPPIQCTLRAQNMYVATVLNVLTDAAMLSIPMPLLWKLQVPLKRKLTLGALLSSGIFVITAAIVRITMTLKAHPSALTINRWGVRETIAGIIAVNLPIVKPIFDRSFWRSSSPGAVTKMSGPSGKSSGGTVGSFSFRKTAAFEMVSSPHHSADNKSQTHIMVAQRDQNGNHDSDIDDTSSEDMIVTPPKPTAVGLAVSPPSGRDVEKGWQGVRVDKSYEIRPTSDAGGDGMPQHHTTITGGRGSWSEQPAWGRGWPSVYGNSTVVHSEPEHRR